MAYPYANGPEGICPYCGNRDIELWTDPSYEAKIGGYIFHEVEGGYCYKCCTDWYWLYSEDKDEYYFIGD